MRIWTYVLIMGIGFTFGLLCGLLIHLPAETLPASPLHEGPHLGRMRRAAQAENSASTDEISFETDQGTASDNTRSSKIGRFTPGSANKQIPQSALVKGDYPSIAVKNPVANPLTGLSDDNTRRIVRFGKHRDNNSGSVVYVNPEVKKLVLDNNVNMANDTYGSNTPRGLNQKLNNNVVRGGTGDTGQAENKDTRLGLNEQSNLKTVTASGILNKDNLIKNQIFWGPGVESSCPKGFTDADYERWRSRSKNGKFVKMESGCGRMQNRLLHFHDSLKACARYRLNIDQIQGEIYSFYLGKILGINNVVPSTLHLADSNLDLWRMVGQDVANAQWSEEKPLIISEWISGLSPAYIPVEFRNLSKIFRGEDVEHKLSASDFGIATSINGGVNSVCELYQWSDLIVFDYLTGNLDRVVNNLFNLQWNDRMMSKPAHNLERDSRGSLVFIDNESGLFHGYRLLDKYSTYHDSLLSSLCVFREGTIRSIRELVKSDNVGDVLQVVFEQNEPLHRHLPRIPVKNIKILKQRMKDVLEQVQKCDSKVH